MVDTGEVRGRLVDAAGAPVAQARISPLVLYPASLRHSDSVPVAGFVTEYETETAADGSFVLRRLPTRGGILATVSAPGFGSPRVHWKTAEPVTIRLERAGSIRGTVTGADDPKTTAGIKLELHGASRGEESPEAKVQVYYFADTIT